MFVPGLVYQELVSSAGEVLDVSSGFAVDAIPHGFAHSQEMRPTEYLAMSVRDWLAAAPNK